MPLLFQDPIVTDRPDFTESALVVPLYRRQLETGLTFEWTTDGNTFTLPEALFRYGISPLWEIRVGSPDFLNSSGSRGWGDSYVGVKRQLGPAAGFDIAIIIATSVPTGDSNLTSNRFDPEWNLCVSRELSDVGSLSGMIRHAPNARSFDTTLSYANSLSERNSVFVEYAGSFGRGEQEHIGHAGIVHRPNPDHQLDLHFGARLRGLRQTFLGAGYSVRF